MRKIRIIIILTSIFFSLQVIMLIQPVEIVAVHEKGIVLVDNFPKYRFFKILWWENNREILLNKYGVGALDRYGDFSIYVHDFGAGYKVNTGQDSDLLCFYEMKEKANCLVKNALFAVNNYNPKKLKFSYY